MLGRLIQLTIQLANRALLLLLFTSSAGKQNFRESFLFTRTIHNMFKACAATHHKRHQGLVFKQIPGECKYFPFQPSRFGKHFVHQKDVHFRKNNAALVHLQQQQRLFAVNLFIDCVAEQTSDCSRVVVSHYRRYHRCRIEFCHLFAFYAKMIDGFIWDLSGG